MNTEEVELGEKKHWGIRAQVFIERHATLFGGLIVLIVAGLFLLSFYFMVKAFEPEKVMLEGLDKTYLLDEPYIELRSSEKTKTVPFKSITGVEISDEEKSHYVKSLNDDGYTLYLTTRDYKKYVTNNPTFNGVDLTILNEDN